MNDGMRLPFENERSWPVQPLWTVFAPIARLADTSLPVLSVSIHSGISDKELSNEERERNVWLSEDRSKYQKVVPGDLVYNSMRAWQGGFGACQTLGLVSPAYGVLSPISTINTKFYELLFRTKGYIALFDTFSPGIIDFRKRLSWDRCKHMKVPVPPLEEQNRIVKFACNVGAKVHLVTQKLQQQLDLLNEYRQSLITRAVTKGLDPNVEMKDSGLPWIKEIPAHWKVTPLRYVITVCTNLVSPADYLDEIQVSPDSIEKGSGRLIDKKTVRESGAVSPNHLFWPNMIIYSKIRPALQKVIISDFSGLCSADMYPIKTGENLKFIFYSMLSLPFTKQVSMFADLRIKMPKINQDELEQILIALPPVEEQEQIAMHVEYKLKQIEEISNSLKRSIEKLSEYRSSLISAAVTGQLAIEEAEE